MTRSPRSWWTTMALPGLLVAAFAGGTLAPTESASAAPTSLTPPVCRDGFGPDFDVDGKPDVAVGVPSEDRGSVAGAGAVEIRYPCSNRASQFLALPRAHAHDGFGTALAVGWLDAAGFTLAVGVPGLDVKGHRNAGGVALFRASGSGLRYVKTLTQASAHVGGSVQTGARFGQTLSTSLPVYDEYNTLRIGEPGRTVSGKKGAGGVVDYSLYRGRYQAARSGEITLATKGVPGSPQTGDAMGASLYADSLVGLPNRTVNGAKGAGAVLSTPRYHGSRPFLLLTQGTSRVPGTPEAGDHFGASLSGSWIGVPGESVDGVPGAGIVVSPSPNPETQFVLNQHDADPNEQAEAGDHFGAAITELGDVLDDEDWTAKQLAIGAPGEDVAGRANAGTASVIGQNDGADGSQPTVGPALGSLQPTEVVAGARFGAVLGRLGELTLQVGAPSARGGRVSNYVLTRLYDSLPTLSATQAQVAGTPEQGDRYGDAVIVSSLQPQ